MNRPKISLRQELPLLIWLVLVWGALWSDFSVGNLAFGAVIAFIITRLFYLPPVELGGRFNILYAAAFAGSFLRELVVASFEVFFLAVVKGPSLHSAVVAVTLRSPSDLMVTATAHVVSLIPGTLVVEVDRSSSTLYLHCLNINDAEGADAVRAQTRRFERKLVRMMGTREEVMAIRAEAPVNGKEAR